MINKPRPTIAELEAILNQPEPEKIIINPDGSVSVADESGQACKIERASPDQESWVRKRILAAINMGLAMRQQVQTGADEPAFLAGLNGIAQGAAVEVIHTLGMEPCYVNLPKSPTGD